MTDRAPHFRRYQRLRARDLNRLGGLAERGVRLKVIGPDIRLVDTPMGKVVVQTERKERLQAQEVGGLARPFRIAELGDDWIGCHHWDDPSETPEFLYVAKAWELRRTPFDGTEWEGVTYVYETDVRRLATMADEQQWEIIVPSYIMDAMLHAIPAETTVRTPAEIPIDLLEISPARMWMKEYGEH